MTEQPAEIEARSNSVWVGAAMTRSDATRRLAERRQELSGNGRHLRPYDHIWPYANPVTRR